MKPKPPIDINTIREIFPKRLSVTSSPVAKGDKPVTQTEDADKNKASIQSGEVWRSYDIGRRNIIPPSVITTAKQKSNYTYYKTVLLMINRIGLLFVRI